MNDVQIDLASFQKDLDGFAQKATLKKAAAKKTTTTQALPTSKSALKWPIGAFCSGERFANLIPDGGARHKLEITNKADTITFCFNQLNGGVEISSTDNLKYWHLRFLDEIGMGRCAREICKQEAKTKDFFSVFEQGIDRQSLTTLGRITIESEVGDETWLGCPPAFRTYILKKISKLMQNGVGLKIVQGLIASKENLTIRFERGKLAVRDKKNETETAILRWDPDQLKVDNYVSLTKELKLVEVRGAPHWVTLGHELIHALNEKNDYDGTHTRHQKPEDCGWDNAEEVFTITGYDSTTKRKSEVSECALLASINYPIRWSHKLSIGDTKAPGEKEMEKFYGPDWKKLKFHE